MPSSPASLEHRAVSKVLWRLVPFMMLLYWFNYLDRVNISVARFQMNGDLKFDDAIFGYGAAIFYIGYFFFEIPSNMLLEKFGARIWIARIMISWGLVSAAFTFVSSAWSFYALRILLGATEAGFFPGMLLFLTYWIPANQRARVGAIFMTSIALACALGQPLSTFILDHMKGVAGLRGWQWLFLLEGICTVLLGFSVYFFMTDKPAQARWLPDDEREWLSNHIASENARTRSGHGSHELLHALLSPRVWLLSMIYVSLMFGFYGIIYWTPIIVKDVCSAEYGLLPNDSWYGVLSAIPYVAATLGMIVLGRCSDRMNNRRGFVAGGMTVGALSLIAASQTHSTVWTLVALSTAAIGILGSLAPFWALPSIFLTGTAAAAGLAFINSWGNLGGGFIGLWVMGYMKKEYNTYTYGLLCDAAMLLLGAVLLHFVKAKQPTPQHAESNL